MSESTSDTPPPVPAGNASPSKKGMSTGAKWGVGCGIGCLGLIILLVIAGIFGWSWISGKIEEFQSEFEEMGMTKVKGAQAMIVTEPPEVPTYYQAQQVTLNFSEPVTVEIGVLAQMCEVNGEFNETLYFRGQIITLNPNAVLKKNLNVECQLIQNIGGTVEGEVTGSYQTMQ